MIPRVLTCKVMQDFYFQEWEAPLFPCENMVAGPLATAAVAERSSSVSGPDTARRGSSNFGSKKGANSGDSSKDGSYCGKTRGLILPEVLHAIAVHILGRRHMAAARQDDKLLLRLLLLLLLYLYFYVFWIAESPRQSLKPIKHLLGTEMCLKEWPRTIEKRAHQATIFHTFGIQAGLCTRRQAGAKA